MWVFVLGYSPFGGEILSKGKDHEEGQQV